MTGREWISGAGTVLAIGAALSLGGCATPKRATPLPNGAAAYAVMPPIDPAAPRTSYQLVPEDVLNLQVFQEPDLSNPQLQVDDQGNIQMPLIGEVPAAGRTASELAGDIAARLREKYIVNPQVVVSIAKSANRVVTVDGQVKKPGVYEIERGATLLSAIARAESNTGVAKLDDVVIFRTLDGRQLAARFDLNAVRAGAAPDPQVLSGDVIVVGYSRFKAAWRDLLQTAPLVNVFYYVLR